jgi:hypothetical protein
MNIQAMIETAIYVDDLDAEQAALPGRSSAHPSIRPLAGETP